MMAKKPKTPDFNKKSDIETSGHVWKKYSLYSLKDKIGYYDEYVCKYCQMKGKKYSLFSEFISVNKKYKTEDVNNCPNAPKVVLPKKVKLLRCFKTSGKNFKNLELDTIHDVIPAPNGYKDNHQGLWVMGVEEPVRLFKDEYSVVSDND